ncbi:hypothetical protein [Candidatus Similichlamydia epinepheli]|uniref:hypothetical protein n=1 Tax=Candidatus Similichlamydia epinepheli TaxID=1903953 RepID=UPI000D361271|nr:hypothetical protein [Candidatus Similichlamydia epinepheli]
MIFNRVIRWVKHLLYPKTLESPPERIKEALLGTNISEEIAIQLVLSLQNRNSNISWQDVIRNELIKLCPKEQPNLLNRFPQIIFLIGENGHGKTTSCVKVANYFLKKGKRVSLVSSDTFRAAAGEQLQCLSNSIGLTCIIGKPKSDPASVVFQGIESGLKANMDVIIVDTSGRLSNNQNLIMELKKSISVANKFLPSERIIPLLVLDNSLGNYALTQAKRFFEHLEIKGYFFTRAEIPYGTIFSVIKEISLPIAFLGTGRQIDDISLFNPSSFIALFLDFLVKSS